MHVLLLKPRECLKWTKQSLDWAKATVYLFQTTVCKANRKAHLDCGTEKRHSLELAPPCIAIEISSLLH